MNESKAMIEMMILILLMIQPDYWSNIDGRRQCGQLKMTTGERNDLTEEEKKKGQRNYWYNDRKLLVLREVTGNWLDLLIPNNNIEKRTRWKAEAVKTIDWNSGVLDSYEEMMIENQLKAKDRKPLMKMTAVDQPMMKEMVNANPVTGIILKTVYGPVLPDQLTLTK